jgi:hypothetical protein
MSTSIGIVWAPWRYFGVWKTNLNPSFARGCGEAAVCAQV